MPIERGWLLCRECDALYLSGGNSVCPKRAGGHAPPPAGPTGNVEYELVYDEVPRGFQAGWRRCSKCRGLWFAGDGEAGHCPADPPFSATDLVRGHDANGSPEYAVQHATDAAPRSVLSGHLRWCSNCQGLWHEPFARSGGACPKGMYRAGRRVDSLPKHTSEGSGYYAVEGGVTPP